MEKPQMIPKVFPWDTTMNPYEVLCGLQTLPNTVLLESAAEAGGLGRYSICAAEPTRVFQSKDGKTLLTQAGTPVVFSEQPLDKLKSLLKTFHVDYSGPLPFYGGAIGAFSYDLKDQLEFLPKCAVRDIEFPDIWLGFYDWAVVFDHGESAVWFVVSPWANDPELLNNRIFELVEASRRGVDAGEPKRREVMPAFDTNMTKEQYLNAIGRVKEYIRNGDIYQVNYTQRFHTTLEGSALELYGKVRTVNPAPFAAWMDIGEFQVVSASPERFVRLTGDVIETRPIKGTRPRGKTAAEDEANRAELLASEKDQAELLMIVDLERNDLGRIAKTGTVAVTELFKLETYATVFHLVSTVKARIREGLDAVDCIRATFPGGSITGAPKIRAMEIIDELEPTARNLYTGSIGYIGYNGDLDLNIVIRTILCKGNDAWFQVGGGIVWDSDPELEYEECLHKAKGQISALSL